MKQRLFIAIPIPENIKKELINITKLPDNFRLTQPQNLHITILFLGETDENNIQGENKGRDILSPTVAIMPYHI